MNFNGDYFLGVFVVLPVLWQVCLVVKVAIWAWDCCDQFSWAGELQESRGIVIRVRLHESESNIIFQCSGDVYSPEMQHNHNHS